MNSVILLSIAGFIGCVILIVLSILVILILLILLIILIILDHIDLLIYWSHSYTDQSIFLVRKCEDWSMFKCEYKLNCTNTAVDLILNSIIIQLINHISSAVCTKTFYFFCSLHKHFLFLLKSAQTLFISSEVCTNTFYFFCSLHKHFLFLLQSAQTLWISSEVCTNTFFSS